MVYSLKFYKYDENYGTGQCDVTWYSLHPRYKLSHFSDPSSLDSDIFMDGPLEILVAQRYKTATVIYSRKFGVNPDEYDWYHIYCMILSFNTNIVMKIRHLANTWERIS